MTLHSTTMLLALGALEACNFDPNHADDGGGDDAAPMQIMECLGPPGTKFEICFDALVPAGLDVTSDLTIDTTDATNCTFRITPPDGIQLCVRAATKIRISEKLRAIGPDPLVLLAIDSFKVDANGVVDASSTLAEPGAGADAAACAPGIAGLPSVNGAGGGAGGSFGNQGGAGGLGGGAAGGVAGLPVSAPPDFVRGGCRGTDGGAGSGLATSGSHGGGAIYVLAGTIDIDGTLNASGAGGAAGQPAKGGAGGGGSGGMIALYAKTQMFVDGAVVFANGGGGGEGADGNLGDAGDDPTMPIAAALGGEGGNGGMGKPGGDGAFRAIIALPGQGAGDGGGGGGGGVGVVRVVSNHLLTMATVSPDPT
jgi:hypothetical protein